MTNEREVRYCTTEDGVHIAYCIEGDGPATILAVPAMIETFSLDHLMPVYKPVLRRSRGRPPRDPLRLARYRPFKTYSGWRAPGRSR